MVLSDRTGSDLGAEEDSGMVESIYLDEREKAGNEAEKQQDCA